MHAYWLWSAACAVAQQCVDASPTVHLTQAAVNAENLDDAINRFEWLELLLRIALLRFPNCEVDPDHVRVEGVGVLMMSRAAVGFRSQVRRGGDPSACLHVFNTLPLVRARRHIRTYACAHWTGAATSCCTQA